MSKLSTMKIMALGLAVLIGSWYWFFVDSMQPYLQAKKAMDEQISCTMEAMLCPDGSAVGRSGSNCEFAKCP